jgi:transposase
VADSLHVDDGLCAVLEPLLPERLHQRIGRPRVDDRIAFTAILFVLVTGVPWRVLPRELRCAGVTAWRRLRDWQAAGIWDRLHRELLRRLNTCGQLDCSTGIVDASHIRALRGGSLTGRSPVDRARTGPKHHLIVDSHGVPLAATLTGGHRNDVTQLLPLIDRIGAVAGKRGRPRQRQDRVIADHGYDHDNYRRELWRRAAADCAARHRARLRTRPRALGGGADVRLAAQLPPAPHRLGTRCWPALRASESRMLADLLAAYPTVTHKRGALLDVELDSDGGAAAFPQMQERDGRRSRAGRRLVRVPSRRPVGTGETSAVPRGQECPRSSAQWATVRSRRQPTCR